MKIKVNLNNKKSGNKKAVQCEPRPHYFFLDAEDSIKNSEVGQIICLNFESARVTLLRNQFSNGGPTVVQKTANQINDL
ncbi:MAG: hypothetical protein H7328_03570 [Bdellovibrio sp.]|nr:hypothetical protein [Bdellovibrio sp.]